MNMTQRRFAPFIASLAFAVTLPPSSSYSDVPESARFERDRRSILAMAGDFQVTFQFDETVTLDPSSKPSKRHISRGFETVIVLSDTGRFIQLQHLLVVVHDGGKQTVVKHWRQDWNYEAAEMLVYRGNDTWEKQLIPHDERKGRWVQTVYQVDDSPRYAGFGEWKYIGDYAYWESNETWRPLPRRELTERDDYDVLVGTNRQGLTPEGWVHEQDNYKLVLDPEGDRAIAREIGVNLYRRTSDFDFASAREYWDRTASFWAAVRGKWDAVLDTHSAFEIAGSLGEPELYEKVDELVKNVDGSDGESVNLALEAFSNLVGQYVHPATKGSDR